MSGSLTPAQCEGFARDGYVCPVAGILPAEAQGLLDTLAAFEASTGLHAGDVIRMKGHLKLLALYRLVTHPAILDAVESLIGPDILCWGSSLFVKDPRDLGFIAWHQDSITWGLEPEDVVSAWIALAPSTLENGAMRVMPGSHLGPRLPHHTTPEGNSTENLIITRVTQPIDEEQAVPLVLRQGEMSLHHVNMLHGSPPNRSGALRCGYAIRYVAPHVRQAGDAATALLARGTDRFGHFAPDPVPQCDMDPAIVAAIDAPLGGPPPWASRRPR
jgi:non-haem Fe2+, alpha-ketoglutarate-dependent halogenase